MVKFYELNAKTLEQVEYEQRTVPIHMGEDSLDEFPDRTIALHWHEEVEFNIVTEGRVELSVYIPGEGLVTEELNAGDSIFINSKALHKFRGADKKTKIKFLVIPISLFDVQYSGSALNMHVEPVISSNITWMKFDRNAENSMPVTNTISDFFTIDYSARGSELQSLEYLYRLWRLLINEMDDPEYDIVSRHALIKDKQMHAMLSYIYANYNKPVTVNEIAAAADISRSECFRIFNKITRETPANFLMNYRLVKAADMLLSTSMKITDVAIKCGFTSSSYFSKKFKKAYGVTPFRYRANGS